MRRTIIRLAGAAALAVLLLAGCGASGTKEKTEALDTAAAREKTAALDTAEAQGKTEAQDKTEALDTAKAREAETVQAETEASGPETSGERPAALEDGVYTARFDTDSSMFHISEACDGKGTLTVEDGNMVIHVSLASKNIVNLFPGLAKDAGSAGSGILEPTTDSVTYSDGITEEVYGFDIPVPALDEEFDLALIGKKGKWYDHKVRVSDPEKIE